MMNNDVGVEVQVREESVTRFMQLLDLLLSDGTAFVRHADAPIDDTQAMPEIDKRTANSVFIGWYDNLYWYLLDAAEEMIYMRANKLCQPIGISGHELKTELRNRKILYADREDRFTYRFSRMTSRPRVLRIARLG